MNRGVGVPPRGCCAGEVLAAQDCVADVNLRGPGPCVFGFVQRRHPRAGQPDVCQVRSSSTFNFCQVNIRKNMPFC